MPPPPATPSPHRFVIKKQAPSRKTPLTEEYTPRPSTQQFNATPRFHFTSTPSVQDSKAPTPSASRYATPANRIYSERVVIDPSSDDLIGVVCDSIEVEQDGNIRYESAEVEDYEIDSRTPKRRRLSDSIDDMKAEHDDNELPELPPCDELPDWPSSPLPIVSSPPAPRRHPSTIAPRFLLSTPAASPSIPASQAQHANFLKPPRFRPPDPASQAQAPTDPLPEQFSPHRRGQKYLPGGLAAEVRDWLVSIESAVPAQVVGSRQNLADPWGLKIVVGEVSGGRSAGMTLVSGRQTPAEGVKMTEYSGVVKIILAGEGQGVGLQTGRNVEVGGTVGVKGVVWEVVIEGIRWGVAVDWKVL